MKKLGLVKYFELNNFEKFFYNKIKELIESEELDLDALLDNSVIDIFSLSDIDRFIENNGFLVFEYTLKYIECYNEQPKNVYQVLNLALDCFLADLGVI